MFKSCKSIALETIKSVISYDHNSGEFYRLKDGISATFKIDYGYLGVSVGGATFKAHRLAWFMFYGKWPPNTIDHINNVRTDNRIVNLRECSRRENVCKQKLHKDNSYGKKGIRPCGKKWEARIKVNRKEIYLGVFKTKEAAASAYDFAAVKYFGEFALTNKALGLL